MDENFDALYTKVNELDSTISQVIPVGTIIAYGGTSAPTGRLLCNRQALNRSTYSALFSTIGTSFGNGDGSTTFNFSDFRGIFLRGLDGTAGIDRDNSSRTAFNGGNTEYYGSYHDDAFLGHWHDIQSITPTNFLDQCTVGSGSGAGGAGSRGVGFQMRASTIMTDNTNGTPRTTLETRPKNVYLNYIIKH